MHTGRSPHVLQSPPQPPPHAQILSGFLVNSVVASCGGNRVGRALEEEEEEEAKCAKESQGPHSVHRPHGA